MALWDRLNSSAVHQFIGSTVLAVARDRYMLRIIAGKYKSLRMAMPADIRPTKDNVREAIFNVITSHIRDARVLDLFAGSGVFGVEALSRGAGFAVFVDISRPSLNTVRDNIGKLDEDDAKRTRLICKDAKAAISLLHRERELFDIIFLDPPYYQNWARKCLKYSNLHDILTRSGLVIVEHYKRDDLTFKAEGLELTRLLKYGDTNISIYNKM
ncbi:MAG: 16S rRNA (guanine(966)-N(2))-methyltransferase RsmD [Candidatus Omnitrophota bacterium]